MTSPPVRPSDSGDWLRYDGDQPLIDDLPTSPEVSQITAAFITPECRQNRGVEGAWLEAVARLRVEYDAVLDGWKDEPEQPTLNLILTMDRA